MHLSKAVVISLSCAVANSTVLGTPIRNILPFFALEPRRGRDKMDPAIGGTSPPSKPKATAQFILENAAANLHNVTTPVPNEPSVPSFLLPTNDQPVKQIHRSGVHEYNKLSERSRVIQDMDAPQNLKRLVAFKKMNQCAISEMNIES